MLRSKTEKVLLYVALVRCTELQLLFCSLLFCGEFEQGRVNLKKAQQLDVMNRFTERCSLFANLVKIFQQKDTKAKTQPAHTAENRLTRRHRSVNCVCVSPPTPVEFTGSAHNTVLEIIGRVGE